MLTFFDYLRQRAFESVLSGAQEALDLLESRQNHSETPAQKSSLPAPDALAEKPAKLTTEGSESGDELLPAPRRRGRPDKKTKGQL